MKKQFSFLYLLILIHLVTSGNLYAVVSSGANLNFGIMDITKAKLTKTIATLPKNQAISTTASRVLIGTEDGVFHIGVEDLLTGKPGLFTVIVTNGTNRLIALDQDCLLYQLAYDEEDNILYGMNVFTKDDGYVVALFTINLDDGTTKAIGEFPLHMTVKKNRVKDGECVEMLGGATILDSDTKMLYLYYSDGDTGQLYYEIVDVSDASVQGHGDFQYDLASACFGDTYETIYALEIGPSPDYKKYFVTYDMKTSRITRQNDIPYWVYYDNEAAYIADHQLYTTIMMTNLTTTETSLISIDVNTGEVTYEPRYNGNIIIWGLKYADF